MAEMSAVELDHWRKHCGPVVVAFSCDHRVFPKGLQIKHETMLHSTYKHKTNTKHRTNEFHVPSVAHCTVVNIQEFFFHLHTCFSLGMCNLKYCGYVCVSINICGIVLKVPLYS
jgi:hypothetical protein